MKEDHRSYRCNFKYAIVKLESLKKNAGLYGI